MPDTDAQPSPETAPAAGVESGTGLEWSLQEAKTHALVERLLERCATYAGATCLLREVPHADWCERCLAAQALVETHTSPEDPRAWDGHPVNLPTTAQPSCIAGGCEWGTPAHPSCCLTKSEPTPNVLDAFRAMLDNANLRARDWQFTARNWQLRAEHSEARERAGNDSAPD